MQTDTGYPNGDGAPARSTSGETLLRDAEHLLKATADYSAENLVAARARFQDSVAKTRRKMSDAKALVATKAEDAAAVTQKYLGENPWKALAIVGSVGIFVGLVMSRRR